MSGENIRTGGRPWRIMVFEQQGTGVAKINGIREYGRDLEIVAVIEIDAALDEFIDNPEKYISNDFIVDLVLDFLTHPDLSEYLAQVCRKKGIPVIASGKKIKNAITPFTCCGLGKLPGLGAYGEQFGMPEFKVEVQDDKITRIEVVRGAPCGATWQVLPRIIGLPVETAMTSLPREVQYICVADPSRFDPISGKSPLHYAGDVHAAALKKALKRG